MPDKDIKKSNLEKLQQKNSLETLVSWQAPERIWHPKNQAWYLGSAAVILFFIFILVRIEWYIGIVALILFMIMWFIQGYLEPLEVKHTLTNKGIYTFNKLYDWKDFSYFWFAQKQDQKLLHLDFRADLNLPRLTLLVPDDLELGVFNVLIEHIRYGEPKQIEYAFFSKLIYGEYTPIANFMLDSDEFQPPEEK